MLSVLPLLLALQTATQQSKSDSIQRQVQRQVADQIARDASERAKRNAAANARRAERSSAMRRPVTPKDLETAFKDPEAKRILNLARVARLTQDSALHSYDATTYQRISAGLSFTRLGRDRLAFRTERVDRVRWDRDRGLWLEVKGARTVLPGIPEIGEREAGKGIAQAGQMAAVPYFPGYEPLWIGPMNAERSVNEVGPVHPMAEGSEAYYTYQTGKPVSIKLGD